METTTEFTRNVTRLIRAIPKGKVATYGLIARLAGKPHGARGVGWILHTCTPSYKLPWQRVIKAGGRLSFPEYTSGFAEQRKLLEAEGVRVVGGRVDLGKFLWDKKPGVDRDGRSAAKRRRS